MPRRSLLSDPAQIRLSQRRSPNFSRSVLMLSVGATSIAVAETHIETSFAPFRTD